MDVLFETGDGRRFEEEIWFFSSIHEIKQKLYKKHGFPISLQTFFFEGKIMEDERDVEYYNVLQGSLILLRLVPRLKAEQFRPPDKGGGQRVEVTVLIPTEMTTWMRRVVVEVSLADNVSELRTALLRMKEKIYGFCLPEERFFFIFKQNIVMKEDKTFRWHRVRSDEVIKIFKGNVTGGL